ncbi:MAG: transposase [Chroococcidiopsidaceae cyanobacterium CP_BM_RX_35]|nr:transposase [Chroococcidiopsidaceae cyanobacterium CP_BM_RX_35]
MTSTSIKFSPITYHFGQLGRRQVISDFSGGQITSDSGLLLIARLDQHYRITERFAGCFEDHRNQKRVQHSLSDLVAQRVYGLVQGTVLGETWRTGSRNTNSTCLVTGPRLMPLIVTNYGCGFPLLPTS